MLAENTSCSNENGGSFRSAVESYTFGVILTVICVLTLIGNGLVIAALMKSWRNTFSKLGNYLVLHVALADLLNGLLTMPLGCISLFTREWIFGSTLCKVSGFLLVFFTTASNVLLSMISLNRYRRLRKLSVRRAGLTRRSFVITLLCWLCGLVAAMASAMDWGETVFVPGFDVNCMVTWNSSFKSVVNMAFVCSILFICPFGVMVITCAKIIALVRRRISRVEPTNRLTTTTISRRSTFNTGNATGYIRQLALTPVQYLITKHAEMRTAVTLSMVLGIFAVCWIPVMVVNILRTFHGDSVPASLQSLVVLLMYASAVCNPIIYSLRNTSFRAEMKDVLSFRRSRPKAAYAI